MTDALPRKRLTRAQAKARTRSLLLDAAARTFARKGFAGASVEEIAETAGFSVGAVYSNFKNKDELFVALLSERAHDRVVRAAEILDGEAADADDPAAALGRLLTEVADKDSEFAPLQAEFWLYAIRKPQAMDVLAAQSEQTREALARVIEHRVSEAEVSLTVPSARMSTIVLALFQGLVTQRRTDPDSVPDDLFGQAVRWLFAGAVTESSQEPDGAPAGE
ncbi:TetR/AcrR family transcriptional regulator [Streptomyces sediminimaris]|uniref:TetR/AcrR family transcriptional regulator n=1 Tax=Streptomyces sediminimaris TaxID=3383721 RepID=UPI00399BAAA5